MAWFKGKLYVGTSRNLICIEKATLEFYYPDQTYYSEHPDEGFTCPADKYDMKLQAEIWQYTPDYVAGGRWRRVFRSPNTIPNPREPGKFVARDIGFRGMVTYKEPDGEEALYVLGVTAGEYIPEIAAANPPRVLRTTDGETFKVVPGAPGILKTAFGTQRPMGYRASVVYDDRLFVTAIGGLTGDGVVEEVDNPSGEQSAFTQVSPQGMQVFEMAVFNGYLYVGTGDTNFGYGVWKTKATGSPPYQFTPVVVGGAGRGAEITSVVSMYVFHNQLYVGASGWYNTLFPASELIRINADDSWDLVVGNTRTNIFGTKSPISGLPDGFGNPFNAHFWRMQEHADTLFLGTNDWSYFARSIPDLDAFLKPQYGFDLYMSCDGQFWFPVTYNAFGDGLYNFGARTMASTPIGGFVGSANYAQGTKVWQATGLNLCGVQAAAEEPSARVQQPPSRLEAETQSDGVVLSWDPAPDATQYRIQRAEHRLASEVGITVPLDLPAQTMMEYGQFRPSPVIGETLPDAWIPGPFVEIGVISQPVFVDSSAKTGTRYTYQVVAENRQGVTSQPSNLVIVPSLSPPVTFEQLYDTIETFAGRDAIAQAEAEQLQALVGQAQQKVVNGDYAGALELLAGPSVQAAQNSGVETDPAHTDLAILMAKLARRLNLAAQGYLSIAP